MSWLLITNVGQPDAELTACDLLAEFRRRKLVHRGEKKIHGQLQLVVSLAVVLVQFRDIWVSRFRRSGRHCIRPRLCAGRAAPRAPREASGCTCALRWDRHKHSCRAELDCRAGSDLQTAYPPHPDGIRRRRACTTSASRQTSHPSRLGCASSDQAAPRKT